jgi:hypothetical protein
MPTKKMRRGLRRSKKLRGGMFSSLKSGIRSVIGISEKPTDCDGSKSCNDLRLYEKQLTKDWGFIFIKIITKH